MNELQFRVNKIHELNFDSNEDVESYLRQSLYVAIPHAALEIDKSFRERVKDYEDNRDELDKRAEEMVQRLKEERIKRVNTRNKRQERYKTHNSDKELGKNRIP